jgi:heme/copper-type cytochrome/quinol oxidase subunit 2
MQDRLQKDWYLTTHKKHLFYPVDPSPWFFLTVLQKRDAPLLYQLTFQAPAIPSMEALIDLHHEVMFYIIIIIVFVLWMLIRIVMLFAEKESLPYSRLTHHDELDWAWTMAPALVLCAIGAPSFALLYGIDDLALKLIDHQGPPNSGVSGSFGPEGEGGGWWARLSAWVRSFCGPRSWPPEGRRFESGPYRNLPPEADVFRELALSKKEAHFVRATTARDEATAARYEARGAYQGYQGEVLAQIAAAAGDAAVIRGIKEDTRPLLTELREEYQRCRDSQRVAHAAYQASEAARNTPTPFTHRIFEHPRYPPDPR